MVARKRQPAPKRSGQQRMWEAMRMHRSFGLADIVLTARVSRDTAMTFIRRLRIATYLIVRNKGVHFGPGVSAVYVLVRDTGPNAPRMLADGRAFDINKQRVIPEAADAGR